MLLIGFCEVRNKSTHFSSIVCRFLSTKLHERIHFHGHDYSSLHKHIPAAVLPAEYGGDLGPMDNSEFFKTMLSHDEQFKNDMSFGYRKKNEKADTIFANSS